MLGWAQNYDPFNNPLLSALVALKEKTAVLLPDAMVTPVVDAPEQPLPA